jgi:allantoicase
VKTGADHSIPPFAAFADLASARVGGRAVAANDEFFASRSNLLKR